MRALSHVLVLVTLCLTGSPATAEDLSKLDLSGEWYVLLHYKDDRSEDESIVKFKDFAWSVQQSDKKIVWGAYPYVLFHDALELVRREAMTSHRAWEPSPGVWERIRGRIGVSSRASTKKTLRGSRAHGFESLPPMQGGSASTITFSRDWKVRFAPDRVRIQITDSLSGAVGLGGMEDSIVYEITERVADDELHGSYEESHKQGTLRMVRSEKREVVK